MKLAKYFLAAAIGLTAGMTGLDRAEAITPAPPGTYQYDLLEPHLDWIKKVDGCCNWGEGRGDFEEKVEVRYDDNGIPYNHYRIVLDPAAYGLPGGPIEIDIPDEAVLTPDKLAEADELCRNESPNSESCIRPAFNVVWMVQSHPDWMGNTGLGWTVFCYLPRMQGADLVPSENRDFAALQNGPGFMH